jgi:hypothetical protein
MMTMQTVGHSSSVRTWTLGRVVAATASLLFLGFGVLCFCEGLKLNDDFEQWLTAKPMEGTIDLSVPGQFVFPFNQTCSSSHGESVSLVILTEPFKELTAAELLAGLDARLEVVEKETSKKVVSALFEIRWPDDLANRPIPIFNIAPFRKGTYQATVTVTGGATKLKGVAQRIEGSYQLCGLEKLPAQIALILGCISVGLGILVGLILALRIAKNRQPSTLP